MNRDASGQTTRVCSVGLCTCHIISVAMTRLALVKSRIGFLTNLEFQKLLRLIHKSTLPIRFKGNILFNSTFDISCLPYKISYLLNKTSYKLL